MVQRTFEVERRNQLWVADFTYVATWRGVVYLTFVIRVSDTAGAVQTSALIHPPSTGIDAPVV